MNTNFMDLDGSNGSYQNEQLREAPAHFSYLDGMESVFEQNWGQYGAFRPHRYLPVRYIGKQDYEGYVMHHGQIVSMINQKTGAGGWNSEAGITTNGTKGEFKTGPGLNGAPLTHDIRGPYGYDRTLDGVLIPTNGTTSAVVDTVTAADFQLKSVLPTGLPVNQSDVNTTPMITRASLPPIGVVPQILRETEGQNLSYRPKIEAISPIVKGVLHIPYIIMGANRVNAPNYTDVGYAAIADRHQFMLVADANRLKPLFQPFVDGYGHLIIPTQADETNYAHRFGYIFSFTNDVFNPLMAYNDAFPLVQSQGTTTTGGLTMRLFKLIESIRLARGQTAKISDIVGDVQSGYYGMVKIPFSTLPINYP
jgi:hypothetical protein